MRGYAGFFDAEARAAGARAALHLQWLAPPGPNAVLAAFEDDPDGARARLEVRGTTAYASCTCPDFARRRCAHLFAAAFLADEQERLLPLRVADEWPHPSDGRRRPDWRQVLALSLDRPRAPRRRTDELTYDLVPSPLGAPTLRISARRRLRDGSWGAPRPKRLTSAALESAHDPHERAALALLVGADPAAPPADEFRLDPPHVRAALPALARSGRLFLDDQPLPWDPAPPWRLSCSLTRQGPVYRPELRCERGEGDSAQPALILDGGLLVARGALAPFDFDADFAWIEFFRQAPDLPAADSRDFLQGACDIPGPLPFPPPPEAGLAVERPPLVPVLRVRSDGERLPATLHFEYGSRILEDDGGAPRLLDLAARRVLERDPVGERRARERLAALGVRDHVPVGRLPDLVRALSEINGRVEAAQGRLRAPGRLSLNVKSGIDWFDLDGGVDFDGRRVSLPDLLKALKSGKGYVPLGDGSVGLLPEDWLRRQGLFLSAAETRGDALRFQAGQAALLDALLESDEHLASADETFRRLREGLHGFERVEAADAPPGFRGELRPYQRQGVGWLRFLRRMGLGGCLADDMGLGKTVQVLAYLESRRLDGGGPFLVVVPRSLLFNWQREAERFAPALRVASHHGSRRGGLPDADLILTTYGTLRRDAPLLKDAHFDVVVLDEAQAAKNSASDTAKAARLLKGAQRLALSGTPVENHLGELWSLMEYLNPGLLGRAATFQLALGKGGKEDRARLARALRPFLLRRTKAQVAPELPERTEQTIWVDLTESERKSYDALRDHYRQVLAAKTGKRGFEALEALLRLRQAACHPGLLDETRGAESSSKVDVLLERLRELAEEGHKALVFSQFTSLLKLVEPRLKELGIAYEYLDGETRDREARVKRFQEDAECRVFLVSLKAGGVGLNLTAAGYVFLMDPWWNPAVEAQAIDRTHRIGQDKSILACRLVARGTVEEKVLELQSKKRELADAILGGDRGLVGNLTREELESLLG